MTINEKSFIDRSSISKEQLKEYNQLKMEINKSREMLDNLLMSHATKTGELEAKLLDLQEENERVCEELSHQREESLYHINICNRQEEEMAQKDRELERIQDENSR